MKKLFIGFFMLLVFILVVPKTALAADGINEQIHSEVSTLEVHPSKLPSLNFNIDPASTYFNTAGCRISKLSNTSIEGTVITTATQIVDKISYILYFQRLEGSRWITIETRSNTYNNRMYLNLSHYKSVERYRTYRVNVKHYITHNNKIYYQESISSPIYLN